MTPLRTYLLLVVLASLLVLLTMHLDRERQASREPVCATCSIVHLRDGHCPPGYDRVTGVFERRGRMYDGCYSAQGNGAIDVLYPEEGVHFAMEVR